MRGLQLDDVAFEAALNEPSQWLPKWKKALDRYCERERAEQGHSSVGEGNSSLLKPGPPASSLDGCRKWSQSLLCAALTVMGSMVARKNSSKVLDTTGEKSCREITLVLCVLCVWLKSSLTALKLCLKIRIACVPSSLD